ncbi:LON peptidase substrate-binding domain-containing protein [Natronospira bacteriovora]|uniref:LON peptidase substrate-binding domain-containing protein n=1 Tax=Natronospira bacteriovora TaxID=3069753 RepID=A0ABU0W6E1_9GAMM|nr:LON peptidase substrate-binding domain-containing protein [Natronospira sp. AB-CW4]MDQ2069574.1 LON peptidase substrate-binding domain-containing protein [Natronospira sp. AB-CW4]
MSETHQTLPLFPLHTVLFPGGPVSLRVFEPRYLAMVSRCLKQDSGFGVVLIRSGQETGASRIHAVGTVARIRDWDRLEDGLLGITALGERRFRLHGVDRQSDGLHIGRISLWPKPEAKVAVPGDHRHLVQVLEQVLPRLPAAWRLVTPAMDDAEWVGFRLAELLPVSLVEKQQLLEMNDPLDRLTEISRYFEGPEGMGRDD